MSSSENFPDFRIPHAEKIEWMIETNGWALEPVAADHTSDPPRAGYAYTIGMPEANGFSDIVVFGLTPVAVKGIVDLVVEQLANGVEIPVDVAVVGLLDGDLRCVFAHVDTASHIGLFSTASKWYRGQAFSMVQLIWPDRNGWLPGEPEFDAALALAQPLIGSADWMTASHGQASFGES